MRNALLVIITCLHLLPAMVHGQEKEMYIEQIAGKKIVRKNFDKNGNLQGKQLFLIGELQREGEIYKVDVATELYNSNGKLNKKYTTKYECNPKEFDVLLNVFPFSDSDDENIKVEVTSMDFKQLYDLQNNNELKDIHLKMSVESGVLSFFGSKSLVTIKKRNKKTENGMITISSKAVIEAYMLGFKIKTINYSIVEYLTKDFILKSQKFTEDDGAYFTMKYDDDY
jgi:hypothetical protein